MLYFKDLVCSKHVCFHKIATFSKIVQVEDITEANIEGAFPAQALPRVDDIPRTLCNNLFC